MPRPFSPVIHRISLTLLTLTLPTAALAKSPQPESPDPAPSQWNHSESIPDYAARLHLPTTHTLSLGKAPNSAPITFTLIPAGTFLMGSPTSEPERLPGEDQHTVRLTRPFLLQTTPVTQAQWKALMGTNPSKFQGDNLPVESVSWNDAVKFCQALSAQDDKIYRLPTEAEWEFACRAGTTTIFSFGNTIDPVLNANFNGNIHYGGGGGTHSDFRVTTTPVDTFKPNPWGLFDMHGNVWQWCSDLYSQANLPDSADPTGPHPALIPADAPRSLRGGSWADTPRFLRAACRESTPQNMPRIHIGFRVLLEIPQS